MKSKILKSSIKNIFIILMFWLCFSSYGKLEISNSDHNQPNIFNVKEDDVILGNQEAKVTVIEYLSLTCFGCSYYHKNIFPKVYEKYIKTNKIKYISRQFITDMQGMYGAMLLKCAADKGGAMSYLKLKYILFAQQHNWAFRSDCKDRLMKIAKLVDIEDEEYLKYVNNSILIESFISTSREFATNKEFIATPAFIINKKPLQSYSNLLEEIENAVVSLEKEENRP